MVTEKPVFDYMYRDGHYSAGMAVNKRLYNKCITSQTFPLSLLFSVSPKTLVLELISFLQTILPKAA